MPKPPSEGSLSRMRKLVEVFCKKSGTTTHPDKEVTELVVLGLAGNVDDLGKPLCPCRFYPDKKEEVRHRTWLCPCDDMQIYKYCHCLLFVNQEGQPITEYLPENHEGRGIVRPRSRPDARTGPRSEGQGRGEREGAEGASFLNPSRKRVQ